MFENNKKQHQALFLKFTSSLSNFPMVARIEMKLGRYAYYIISMTITFFHDDRILFEKASGNFLKLLLPSSNLLTVAHMEVKLGTHRFHDNDNNK